MKKGLLLQIIIFLAGLPSLMALEIQGVPIAPHAAVAGETLQLNGAGLRSVVLLFVPIRAYVAAFYVHAPLRSEREVSNSSSHMQFDFTFLGPVTQSLVTKAWQSQFAQSVSYTYPDFEKDRDAFIALFGPVKCGGMERVQFIGSNTVVYDACLKKGTIVGKNFQRAFLSLWFGSNPVQNDLKIALLGNSNGCQISK
jgi:hypothetical protein